MDPGGSWSRARRHLFININFLSSSAVLFLCVRCALCARPYPCTGRDDAGLGSHSVLFTTGVPGHVLIVLVPVVVLVLEMAVLYEFEAIELAGTKCRTILLFVLVQIR